LLPAYKIVAQKKFEKLQGRISIHDSTIGKIKGKDYLFVSLGKEIDSIADLPGILIYDIENPQDPTEVAYLPAPEDTNEIADLVFLNDRIYISACNYLWIVNVSVPSVPRSLSLVRTMQPVDGAVSGQYLYLDDNGIEVGGKITVVDISNQDEPQIIGSLDLSPAYSFSPFKVHGSRLYTFAQNDDSTSLYILDISSSGALNKVANIPLDRPDSDNSSTSIPADDTLLKQPLSPMVSSEEYDIVFDDHYAYIAIPGEGLYVMDMSDPIYPKKIAVFSKPEKFGTFSGNRLYISDNLVYLISRSITIIDVSNPAIPEEIASFPLPEYYYALTKSDQYIYYFITDPPGIEVMDVSLTSK